MTLIDDGYSRFMELVKQLVHLEVLLRVIEHDRQHFSSLKMGTVWHSLLDKVIDDIVRDMTEIRREIRQMDGKILKIKQEEHGRRVDYVYRGYQMDVVFLNEWMKAECEKLLRGYLTLCRP